MNTILAVFSVKHIRYYEEFLKDWYEWATTGAPDRSKAGVPYRKDVGLCNAADRYAAMHGVNGRTWEVLRARFVEQGREPGYPFGHDRYFESKRLYSMHVDTVRLDWVENELKFIAKCMTLGADYITVDDIKGRTL